MTLRCVSVFLRSCFLLSLLTTSSSSAQDTSGRRFLRWSYQDAAGLVTSIQPKHALRLTGGLVVIGGVSLLDKYLDDEVKEGYQNSVIKHYADVTEYAGGPLANIPVVAIFGVSLLTDNTRFQDAAFTSLESLVYAGTLSYAVKYAVGRVRPEDSDSQYRFRMFSGHSSFPSGHMTATFAILTPWVIYYPSIATYSALGVVGLGVGLARISHSKHWASDVVAGSLQGALVAAALSRRHKRLQLGASKPGSTSFRVSAEPTIGIGSVSMRILAQF